MRKGPQEILVEKRGRSPFKGMFALPGGHVDYGEKVEEAALRELKEECSIDAKLVTILGVYSDPKRDPRGQTITTVFISDWAGGNIKAGDDAASAEWMNVSDVRNSEFAFDHKKIIEDYLKWENSRGTQTYWSSK